MAAKGQMTGMRGVYLVAAELSGLGFIVSPTSRSAIGADLLVTDQCCKKAWSVQVKTNEGSANFWLLSPNASKIASDSHMYVFVNIGSSANSHEYFVVLSNDVSKNVDHEVSSTGSEWYSFAKAKLPADSGWKLFGEPY